LDSSGSYCFIQIIESYSSIINPDFSFSIPLLVELFVLAFLLFSSGFVSGAETAFFAITPPQLMSLKDAEKTSERLIYNLLNKPKRLLATLLIAINFVNIAIVVLSTVIINQVFDFSQHETAGFIIQVIAVTFIIILFCEVMPKVYAQQNAMTIAHLSVYVLYALDKLFRPVSVLLVASTNFVEKRFHEKGYDVTVDELTHAIDITSNKDTPEEEKKILKGIARFGNIDVKQIMRSRIDVLAIEYEISFKELLPIITENRYSRIPVYKETLDSITGILYSKDLLPYLDKENENFEWQSLIRSPYYVPESKKINDLLQEFQEKKMHLAIVVDEYGGTSGLVTMEDILEEIVGEINDEFDEVEISYSKLDERTFVFEGKTLLNDICRVMEVDRKIFEIKHDEADTLAGLILDLKGSIPQKGEEIFFRNIKFTIESSDRRRIKRVKITLPEKNLIKQKEAEG
jgi:putative hemolysin